METEVSLRKRLDGPAESSRYGSAEFWAPPVAPIETSPPADAGVSRRVRTLYTDEDNLPQLLQHTDLSSGQRSFGSGRKLITGIAVVLTLGLSALAYFFLPSASEKTTTQTAELAPSIPTPAEASPSAAPAAATSSTAPAAATPSTAPAAADSERPPEPVQASPKVAQSQDILYLQRPGVNIRSTPSPSGSAVGTAPKGTRFKVTSRQGDWIQVENGRLKGWINARFLAPGAPR
jgi:Bacterial SH3 domain